MERMFPTPVFPHSLSKTDRITGKRGQEKALFDRDRTAYFAVGLDQATTGDLGPRALHASARDIRRDPIVTCFQATMIGVSGRMALRGDVVKPLCCDVLEPELHCTMQRRMGVLKGQDVVSSLRDHGLGHLFLTPHGVDRDHGAFQLHQLQQQGNRRDCVGLVIDFQLTSHQPLSVGPRAHHGDGACGGGLSKGAPQRFAIDRDAITVERRTQGLGPPHKALGEFIGLEPR